MDEIRKSKLLIACAGSGKTTAIVRESLKLTNKRILITTFTDENTEEVKRKFYEENHFIPDNVSILPWFTFELRHLIRPFQGKYYDRKINQINMVNSQSGIIRKNGKFIQIPESKIGHYFDGTGKVYSDKLAKLSLKTINESKGKTLERLKRLFSVIFIDEVQDLAGYDLELLKLFMENGFSVIMAGDPRQKTYSTHFSAKYKKYNNDKVAFVKDMCGKHCLTDETTLNVSHRCAPKIIELASKLFPEYPESKSSVSTTDGEIYFVTAKTMESFLEYHKGIVQLRYDSKNKQTSQNYPVRNIGVVKGRSYDSVLIFPTKDMLKEILGEKVTLTAITRCKLYVALTRARYVLGIFVDEKTIKENTNCKIMEWKPK